MGRPVIPGGVVGGPADDDPGWGITPLYVVSLLVPFVPGRFVKRRAAKGTDALVAGRQVFLAFVTALPMFQLVLLFLQPDGAHRSNTLALALLALGGFSCFVLRPLVDKPLRCDGPSLPGQFQTRMFMRIALSEAAALLGFVGFFTANVRWVYPVAMFIAYVGFFSAAPSRRNLARDQEDLRRQGCNVSLVRAMRGLDS